MDKFTAPLLLELIDRIDVYEVTGMGKNRKQQIWVRYKFVRYGAYERCGIVYPERIIRITKRAGEKSCSYIQRVLKAKN